jgi:hypothetical protein
VVDDKVLTQVGRESVMLLPNFDGAFWAYMKLSFGYLGYCGPCRDEWEEIVEAGRWESAKGTEIDFKAVKEQIGSW